MSTIPEQRMHDHADVPAGALSLQFIGNATVLLRSAGFTVLTDPNFLHRGQRAYLGWGLSSRRLREPALDVGDLPPLDVIVLSHLHGDHWDRVTRRRLPRGVPVVTTPHAARRLQGLHGFRRAVGLRSWERHDVVGDGGRLSITALPGRHAPGIARRLLPPVMGSLLEFAPAGAHEQVFRLYVTGDTLLFDGVHAIARRVTSPDAAVVHLGGTRLPGGLMVTMDGEQGAELVELVRPRQAVPVHYDDYTVMASPLSDFRAAVRRRGLEGRITYVQRGATALLRRGGASAG